MTATWRYNTDGYIELMAEQRSTEWFEARKYRITSSILESLITNTSKFSTMKETIQRILGNCEPTITNEHMQRGTKYEPYLRDAYKTISSCDIYEPGLCIGTTTYDHPMITNNNRMMSEVYPCMLKNADHPNWYIGASPDGIIKDIYNPKALEIKCPKEIPKDLLQNAKKWNENKNGPNNNPRYHRASPGSNMELYKVYSKDIEKLYGPTCPLGFIDYYGHIYLSHFLQMQQHMHVLRKKECVYLVGTFEGTYIETVKFDERYYKYVIYPKLVEIVESKIKPEMPLKEREEFSKRVRKIIKNLPQNTKEYIINW